MSDDGRRMRDLVAGCPDPALRRELEEWLLTERPAPDAVLRRVRETMVARRAVHERRIRALSLERRRVARARGARVTSDSGVTP